MNDNPINPYVNMHT